MTQAIGVAREYIHISVSIAWLFGCEFTEYTIKINVNHPSPHIQKRDKNDMHAYTFANYITCFPVKLITYTAAFHFSHSV